MAYTCGAHSPLSDVCMLDSGHAGPHVAQDKAEWLGGVWLQEPAPKPEPESHYDKFVDRVRKQWHATPGLGGLYDESEAESPEQLAAMQRLNAAELERRAARAEMDQMLEDGQNRQQQYWAEHVESMERDRAKEQRRQLRNGLIAVAVALVLFVVLLVRI